MANRHLSRSIVLQSLFEWDFRSYSDGEIGPILERNLREFAPGISDSQFVKELAEKVLGSREKIDSVIEKAAPEWPMAQISIVDRNVLRIGLYELLLGKREEVPAKVAINEAIELAKTFGGETSGKFVNGVLGTIYKEIGEPGKEETSSKKKKKDMPLDKLAGALVIAKEDGETYAALVHDVFGHWTLPKGGIEDGLPEVDGMMREIWEEIGLRVKSRGEIGRNEYIASDPSRGKVRKQVIYFLAESDMGPLNLKVSGGLDSARWFPLSALADLEMYDDVRPLVAKGIKLMLKK